MRQQEKRPNKKVLERLAADAALAAGLPDTLDVAVVFLPEKKMAELNWESLRHEGPTFPTPGRWFFTWLTDSFTPRERMI